MRAATSARFQRRICLLAALLALCPACADRSATPAATDAVPAIYVAIDPTPADFHAAALEVTKKRLDRYGVAFEADAVHAPVLELDLHLAYRNMTENEFETIWRTTTFFLATLYPSTCAHRLYTLTAQLRDASGNVREYVETDSTVAWLWLFQGPRCGSEPSGGEIDSVTRRLLDALYDHMRRDDVLANTSLVASGPQAPLVLFVSNRGAAIAEQVLRVDRPVERWTVQTDSAAAPDYRVNLFFEVRPGGPSIHRAYLSIMTLGLAGFCKATAITLIATVTGPTLADTRAYMKSKSLRGHLDASSNCEVQDETTKPEAFAALLRQVFAAMARDAVIPPVLADVPAPPVHTVHIVSAAAEGIVQRQTIRSKPFPRYAFGAASTPLHYSLDIGFAFTGGGLKSNSVGAQMSLGLSIAWLGKHAGCAPTTMTLSAVLRDENDSEMKRYQIVHSVPSTGNLAAFVPCRDDELTNPGAVADLVKSLYEEMRADGTLALVNHDPSR